MGVAVFAFLDLESALAPDADRLEEAKVRRPCFMLRELWRVAGIAVVVERDLSVSLRWCEVVGAGKRKSRKVGRLEVSWVTLEGKVEGRGRGVKTPGEDPDHCASFASCLIPPHLSTILT